MSDTRIPSRTEIELHHIAGELAAALDDPAKARALAAAVERQAPTAADLTVRELSHLIHGLRSPDAAGQRDEAADMVDDSMARIAIGTAAIRAALGTAVVRLWHPINQHGRAHSVTYVSEAGDGYSQAGWWLLVDWDRSPAVDPIDGTPSAPVWLGEDNLEAARTIGKMGAAEIWNALRAEPIAEGDL